jgi:hypothetical protein
MYFTVSLCSVFYNLILLLNITQQMFYDIKAVIY